NSRRWADTPPLTRSLHDALPISASVRDRSGGAGHGRGRRRGAGAVDARGAGRRGPRGSLNAPAAGPARACTRAPPGWTNLSIARSEEHTSELQSRENLVCRLLLE